MIEGSPKIQTGKSVTVADEFAVQTQTDSNWYELRADGRNPERRSNHTSFMIDSKMFIYGGYDIERGPMQTMWSFDTNNVANL